MSRSQQFIWPHHLVTGKEFDLTPLPWGFLFPVKQQETLSEGREGGSAKGTCSRPSTSGEEPAAICLLINIFLRRRCKVFITFSKMSLMTPSKVGTPGLFQTFLSTSIPTHLCCALGSLNSSSASSPRDLPFSDTMGPASIFFQRRL